jgi:hypothetical protein
MSLSGELAEYIEELRSGFVSEVRIFLQGRHGGKLDRARRIAVLAMELSQFINALPVSSTETRRGELRFQIYIWSVLFGYSCSVAFLAAFFCFLFFSFGGLTTK